MKSCYWRLALLVKFSADDILKYFTLFNQQILQTICMNCQILFSGENKKIISSICRLLN